MAHTRDSGKKATIVVAGDLSIDWFEVSRAPQAPSGGGAASFQNWMSFHHVRRFAKPGGAWLLADFVRAAGGDTAVVHSLSAKHIERIPATELIQAFITLDRFPYSSAKKDEKNWIYRIKSSSGFDGPQDGRPSALPFPGAPARADMIVIDDAGNGFRDHKELWPEALKKPGKPVVVVKMNRPLAAGALFEEVRSRHRERLVIVINADDLRQEGIKISRRLSWERTAKEFVWQMASNPRLLPLSSCVNLVVRFGLEGAILYSRFHGKVESWLFYDPKIGEDGFGEVYPGEMIGCGSAFVAGIVGRLARGGLEGIKESVIHGLAAARRLWQQGFRSEATALDYPDLEVFKPLEPNDNPLAMIQVPKPTAAEPADPDFWCILDDLSRADLESIAYNFVLKGRDPLLDQVPCGQFRFLKAYDRSEIESFRSIKNLINEYLANADITRPLSISVFGTPGSGKSFGVNEVAESVAPGRLKKIEFNLSQFNSIEELVAAFHKVRDIALGGKIPMVFFDEFDSDFKGKLGWLKYFLAPMQDGVFSDGQTVHPIGRAIFVFAGGTCCTYEEFCCRGQDPDFRAAKGPDFISRLRGYVDIKGPNPVDGEERLFLIRRAQVLRFQLEKNARQIFDGGGNCRIDPGVLRAMIKVPRYRHGIRSMVAVIEMSLLSGRQTFEQAALTSPKQLELHVDAEMFSRLVVRDVLLGSARELLARAIHEKYRLDNRDKRSPDDPSMQPWDELLEEVKESNRQQADHIPRKLKAVGCDFAPVVRSKPKPLKFSDREIEVMAEIEHDRWVAEKFLQGFSFGPRDVHRKTSPYLVAWEDLTEEIKDFDRQAVSEIPELLASAGFEIYRLKTK
ncbi:MAG TPA: RyR domain-containing protein [Candidatus Desulfaltia sp.]|nr:RyR domain-containing protein [Candidatus Desulfaltia sp.]